MDNKTREQMILEEKYKLIRQAVKDGFYYFEVAIMFKVTEGRVSQIVKAENKQSK